MNENETEMNDELKVYEISFIFDSHLDEAQTAKKFEVLKKDIASLGGSFISEETPYLRELSYTMIRTVNHKKVKFESGYFGWVKFEILPENILTIENKLKLDEEVIRFLVVKADRLNDVFTKDIPVIKSDPSIISNLNEESEEAEEVNLDSTKEIAEDSLDEEKKKDLDKEIEDLDIEEENE